ncbi:MAG: hypothetical protein AB1489_16950, partial [Acidobacteriota bacterium]
MFKVQRLGLIRSPKEKLVAAILEILRNQAPECIYRFREEPNQTYQLTIYCGAYVTKLVFTEQ